MYKELLSCFPVQDRQVRAVAVLAAEADHAADAVEEGHMAEDIGAGGSRIWDLR